MELSWRERGRLWLRLGLRLVLTVLLVLAVWKLVPPLLELFMPFVVAGVLAWVLNPLVRFLEQKLRVRRRVLSVLLMVLAIAVVGGLAAGVVYALAGQIWSLLQNGQSTWSHMLAAINAVLETLEEPLSHLPGDVYTRVAGMEDSLISWLSEAVPRWLGRAASGAGSFAMSLPSLVVGVIICVMATYFISADYPNLRAKLAGCVPGEFRGFFSRIKQVAARAFGGYVRAEFLLSVAVFFILLVGFALLGETYGLLLAFALAVLDFIPIVGAGTVMVPWAVVDLVLGQYRHAVGLMVVWGVIVLFRRVAEPKFVGDQTGLSPIASLVSIYVGMRLGGVVGMVLGPVLCLIVLNVARGGAFDNTLRDLRMALGDISAILKGDKE